MKWNKDTKEMSASILSQTIEPFVFVVVVIGWFIEWLA
jgi:hypothetical protein